MKVIFLDVDGVLNSISFYEKQKNIKQPLDERAVECLSKIVDKTGAKIVLTSSWRGGWDKNPDLCDAEGKILNSCFDKAGLKIYDKTDCLDISDEAVRCKEIKKWIGDCPQKIERFVIIDDANFNWDQHGLKKYWVRTDFMKDGLSSEHVDLCIHKLNKRNLISWIKHLLFGNGE